MPWLAARAMAPAMTSLRGFSAWEGGGGGGVLVLTLPAPFSLACMVKYQHYCARGGGEACPKVLLHWADQMAPFADQNLTFEMTSVIRF